MNKLISITLCTHYRYTFTVMGDYPLTNTQNIGFFKAVQIFLSEYGCFSKNVKIFDIIHVYTCIKTSRLLLVYIYMTVFIYLIGNIYKCYCQEKTT